ncbi:MAG TPA: hypothetical protein VHR45_12095 [Thermoanaerobaculia bacterium]|nr:hypothetical protein [Thermoanaerobaculia bacterium]
MSLLTTSVSLALPWCCRGWFLGTGRAGARMDHAGYANGTKAGCASWGTNAGYAGRGPDAGYASTHSLLRRLVLAQHQAPVSITTPSTLILRDLDLLLDLDRHTSVTVRVPIPTVSPELARWLEPPGLPAPWARLETVRTLAAHGIATAVVASPILPQVNDDEDAIRPLLAAARAAGAYDVLPALPALPANTGKIVEIGSSRDSRQRRKRFAALFSRLRLAYGFPQVRPGRG